VFATQYLEHTRVSEGVAADVDALWTWHSLEELEHKSVCFDLFQAIGGSYAERTFAMGVAVPLVFILVLTGQADLIRRDPGALSARELATTLRYFVSRTGVFPRAARAIARYFHPDFHPWQEDTKELTATNRPRYQGFALQRTIVAWANFSEPFLHRVIGFAADERDPPPHACPVLPLGHHRLRRDAPAAPTSNGSPKERRHNRA